MNLLEQQKELAKNLHPELVNAVASVYTEPEVQKAIETLGKYGLGACLPHKHNKDDEIIPLPFDEYQDEIELKIDFKKHKNITQLDSVDGIFLGWRANKKGELNFFAPYSWVSRCPTVGGHPRKNKPQKKPSPKGKGFCFQIARGDF